MSQPNADRLTVAPSPYQYSLALPSSSGFQAFLIGWWVLPLLRLTTTSRALIPSPLYPSSSYHKLHVSSY